MGEWTVDELGDHHFRLESHGIMVGVRIISNLPGYPLMGTGFVISDKQEAKHEKLFINVDDNIDNPLEDLKLLGETWAKFRHQQILQGEVK